MANLQAIRQSVASDHDAYRTMAQLCESWSSTLQETPALHMDNQMVGDFIEIINTWSTTNHPIIEDNTMVDNAFVRHPHVALDSRQPALARPTGTTPVPQAPQHDLHFINSPEWIPAILGDLHA
jgi:hypothetical protein